jgi:hypothetical protein
VYVPSTLETAFVVIGVWEEYDLLVTGMLGEALVVLADDDHVDVACPRPASGERASLTGRRLTLWACRRLSRH